MSNIAAFNAMKYRESLKTGVALTNELIVVNILPRDSAMKREDIMRAIFNKYGKQYDDDSVRNEIDMTLSSLVRQGVITRVSHGVYKLT